MGEDALRGQSEVGASAAASALNRKVSPMYARDGTDKTDKRGFCRFCRYDLSVRANFWHSRKDSLQEGQKLLEHKLTPNHAGIALWGDFAALDRLHEFVHHIVKESAYIEDKEGIVTALAYDLRKAFQGQRSHGNRTYSESDRCHIYGVEVLWPALLVQVGVLREAMAFMPTNKLDQSIMFELEYVVESALRAAMPVTADEVIHWMRCIGNASYIHLDSVFDSRCSYFINRPAKQRLKVLPKLMETFDPMYELLAETGARLRPGAIPPSAFAQSGEDWPDFEW